MSVRLEQLIPTFNAKKAFGNMTLYIHVQVVPEGEKAAGSAL